jgi:hypothetical protein
MGKKVFFLLVILLIASGKHWDFAQSFYEDLNTATWI